MLNAFKAKIPQAAIPWIHGLLEKVDSATKPQIYTKLATLAALDRKQALALLKSKNLEEKKAAILALCLPSEDHYKQKFQDKNLGLEHLKKLETSLDLAELSIAIEIKQVIAPKDFSFFLHFFNSKDQKIALKAAAAIAATIDKNQAHIAAQLITKMAQPNSYLFRKHCIDALQKIYNSSMIPNILESSTHFQAKEKRYLLQMLSSSQRNIPALFDVFMGNYSLHARKLAAHALHHLQPSLLLKHVENTIEQMIKSCHFNFYFAHMLTKEPAFKRLFLTSFYETLNFIIEVLGLTGKIEDPQILVFSLRSKNEKTHAHAVETIEKTTSYQIFRFLEPLISDDPLSDRIAQSLKFFPEFATMEIEDILNTLANSSQLIDQISFALLAKKRDFKDWKKEVFSRLKNSDIHYHQFAMELMNT